MSRLELRKKKRTVVEELSTDNEEDLGKFKRVTLTMRQRDINDLEAFVNELNREGRVDEPITKSYIVRKALRILYAQKDSVFKWYVLETYLVNIKYVVIK